MKTLLTLTLIQKNKQILLGYKKRGFGIGRFNGFGGKVEKEESVKEAAYREVFEEAGIEVHDLEEIGIIDFSWNNQKNPPLTVYVFKADSFSGQIEESEEMKPEWFEIDKIPYKKMWDDDRYWFPYFLQNKKFQAEFIFDSKDKVVEYNIQEMTDANKSRQKEEEPAS
ncbi:MAG: 8-oxo-dGTP diphosphatase [Patescibacteria group bacterium]|nr:8-oxo-dGTP diphosphatase [Patescibacteria group bacterium]